MRPLPKETDRHRLRYVTSPRTRIESAENPRYSRVDVVIIGGQEAGQASPSAVNRAFSHLNRCSRRNNRENGLKERESRFPKSGTGNGGWDPGDPYETGEVLKALLEMSLEVIVLIAHLYPPIRPRCLTGS